MRPSRYAFVSLAHAALLVAPIAAIGRWREAARPEAIACVAALVAFAIAETAARGARSDTSRMGAPGTRTAVASGIGLLLTAWLAIGVPSRAPLHLWVAAAVACALGIALRVLAIRALGDAFSSETVLAPGRPVVRRGVYALLRHPSDAGLLLFTAGLVALSGSLVAIAPAALLLVPSVVIRVAREDRLIAADVLSRAKASVDTPSRSAA